MGASLKKLNFFVEEDVRREMETLVPAGRRARVINEALRRELLRIKREGVTARLKVLKSAGAQASSAEIAAALRKDRKRT
jgi:hypothetical protein